MQNTKIKEGTFQTIEPSTTAHYRDVLSLMKAYGIPLTAAAAQVGRSVSTLKSYARPFGSVAWRPVPPDVLDKLRDMVVEAYWLVAEDAFVDAESKVTTSLFHMPTYVVLDDAGFPDCYRAHPLLAQEKADKIGGVAQVHWSAGDIVFPELAPKARRRSQWRQLAFRFRQEVDDREVADEVLCSILDCSRWDLWRYETEFAQWQQQVAASQVERLRVEVGS